MVKVANRQVLSKEELIKYITENKSVMTDANIHSFATKHSYSYSHIRGIIYGTQSGSLRILNPLKSFIEKLAS